MLILCTVVLANTAFASNFVAYAEDVPLTDVPLAYEYTAASGDETAYYTVTGVDKVEVNLLDETQKKNLKITIPATYNNGTNEAPVKVIGEMAFSFHNSSNRGLTFSYVDFSKASNLTFIDKQAFLGCTSKYPLILPENLQKIEHGAFWGTSFSALTFNEKLDYVCTSAFTSANITSALHLPKNFTTYSILGKKSITCPFSSNKFSSFTVDKDNEQYMAMNGVLYSKDGATLICYPGSMDAVDFFRVPDGVERIAYYSFSDVQNIGGIITPNSLRAINDAGLINANVKFIYLSHVEDLYSWNFAQESSFTGQIIIKDKETFDALTGPEGILSNATFKSKINYINAVNAAFDAGTENIYKDADAEQLKQYFTVTGDTASGITGIPLYDFTLTLPEGGLAVGSNEIIVSVGSNSKIVNITAVEKNTPVAPDAPDAPVVSGTPTANSITLTAIEGAEYSLDGVIWQDSPTFDGLTANTEYTFYARLKATDTANASAVSEALTIKTAALPDEDGLSGGAIAAIVIVSVLLAGILALLAMFLFRKDKSQGFKAYYAGLCGTCATTVKGWGDKIDKLFRKNKKEADQAPVEPEDEKDEPMN